jgi:hypothetical protein
VHLPEPHPDPPADIHLRRLPIEPSPGPSIRSYERGRAPIFFGRTGLNRFDAPAGQFGALYVGVDIYGAFIETFGRQLSTRDIQWAQLAAREMAVILQSRPLRLVDLIGPGLSRIGADARLADGSYEISRRWALAFHEHPDQPDGILYRSRHDPSRFCIAIFDRAASALSARSIGSLADPHNTDLLADLLGTYEYGLIGP